MNIRDNEDPMTPRDNNEEGMALLFTLGILALLLVLAMAFASTARMGRKAAANNSELTAARFLAESALQRAMGAMRYYRETGGNQYDNMISHDVSGGANQKTYDWLYHIETVIDGATILDWPNETVSYHEDAPSAIHWQYVDNGRSGSDQRLIGRIAYKVFGSGGKLDPSSCVRHTAAMVGVPAGTAVAESPATEVRNGIHVYEVNIQNLTRSDAVNLPSSDVLKLSSDLIPGGMLCDSERWSDWGNLFSELGISSASKKEKWRSWFDIERPVDTESFWVDSSGDGIEEPSELYHRFNLAREESNPNYPGTEPDNPGWSQLAVDDILSDPVEYSEAAGSFYGKSIKWLKNYANLPVDTFPNAQTKARQIAANLIDYCDNNRAAKTDSTTAPTYTGNDQSPYINEVRIQIDGDVVESPAGTYNLGLTLTTDVEVVNIYDTTDNQNFNLDVILSVSGQYYWGPKNSATPVTFEFKEGDNPIIVNINSVGDRCYATGTSTSNDISEATWTGAPGLGKKINNFKITKLNVKLVDKNTGDFYDFAYMESASGEYDIKANDSDNDRYYYLDYEVNDPRQNLNEGDWALSVSKKSANGTLGIKNSICNPNPGGNKDVEAGAVEPWDVSTAYIRNSYMRSPWEIGFIHRGAAWETLRIYLYNRNDDNDATNNESGEWGVSPAMGISSWQWGDANILDQVKMSGATECFGKINLNSTSSDVLNALVGGIRIGSGGGAMLPNASRTTNNGTDDSEPGALAYGTELTYPAAVNSIAVSATNSIKVPGASAAAGTAFLPYRSRGQVASTITQALSNSASMTTDALKEEVIGKFINLSKASPDTVTIIVLAQTFKDLGGITVYKDLDGDGDTDGNVVENGVDIDGEDSNEDGNYTNDTLPAGCETITTTYGKYDKYAEEILSEQKIMATVIYDQTTQKWRILKYEYIE